jgi:CheY-like chemotaxis protein
LLAAVNAGDGRQDPRLRSCESGGVWSRGFAFCLEREFFKNIDPGNKTILYAEDNPDDILIFKRTFARASLPHSLYTVDDGEMAVEWLSGRGAFGDRMLHPIPSVLILDLKMPKISGFEVLAWVRESQEHKSLPVVIMSSSDEPKDMERARELGASSYFVKSAPPKDLIEFLKRL